MSIFTDIFIRRPVLATVVSLLILFVGLRSLYDLPVREFPKLENTVITVTTSYPGAPAKLIEGFITTPIEKKMAGADGIDYMTSSSTDGVSTIKAYIKLNFSPDVAFTNIMAKVAEVRSELPKEAEDPVIQKATGSTVALMYISFNSKDMSSEQITDYISRVVQPKVETVPGVAEAKILGGKTFAMRIWLNPKRMAAFGVTPGEVATALQDNNFQAAAGKTKGQYVAISINANTDVQNVNDFKNIVVKHSKMGALVRLKDIANVELGTEDYDSSVYFNGKRAVFLAITATPDANPLTVITDVKKVLPNIKANLPPSLQQKVVYDATKYIRASIKEVITTILEATVIVIIVIFLFLGSLRTVIIPVVTIPLSLIGVMTFMLALGYSINLLTLLAMVLAIGLVVDDAIVVVENIYRHIEEGMPPFKAALQGAREIATPIIAMSITLAAVYAPIGFMGGLTGGLFKEFAFTLASAVIISGVIALTLSPMMCSRLLSHEVSKNKFVHFIDDKFDRLKNWYQRSLHSTLKFKSVMVIFAFFVLLSCFFLYLFSQKQLAPQEDKGVVFVIATGPEYATLNYMRTYTKEFEPIYNSISSKEDYFTINGSDTTNTAISAIILKPWDQRKQTQKQANAILQEKFDHIPGLQIQAFPLPSLPTGGSGLPLEFVITSTQPFSIIYPIMQKMVAAAQKSGLFLFVNGTLRFNKPQLELKINRSKAAQLGLSMKDIATALGVSLGGNYVNRFNLQGRSYKVIPQLGRRFRLTPMALNEIHVKTESGNLIPLSTVVTMKTISEPNALTHFQQLNSATIQGLMAPGHTLDDGLVFMRKQAKKYFVTGVTYDYAGQSRQLVQEGAALLYTFMFSIIVIFLVLAAQFESFRNPLVIMISVPMAICGALLPINWGVATINIFTQVGLITLIGLISKHGILMVDFANKLRDKEGLSDREAIEKAAAIRLRPILMTTAATILGVVPLIIATGAGAASRFDIGLVIASGMAIGTLFTLFVVPTMYTLKTKSILTFLGLVALVGLVLGYLFFTFF